MNTTAYLNFKYQQSDYIFLPVGWTTGKELELCWGARKLTYQDYLKAQEHMAQAEAERARIQREAVTTVPAFALRRKSEKRGRW